MEQVPRPTCMLDYSAFPGYYYLDINKTIKMSSTYQRHTVERESHVKKDKTYDDYDWKELFTSENSMYPN